MSSTMIRSFYLERFMMIVKIELNPNKYFLSYLEVYNVIYFVLIVKSADDMYCHMKSSVNDS